MARSAKNFGCHNFCDDPSAATGDVAAQPSNLIRAIDFVPGMVAKTLFWGGLFAAVCAALWVGGAMIIG
jgi:hypothetical protein